MTRMEKSEAQERLIEIYAEIVKTTNRYPSREDLNDWGYSRDQIRRLAGNLAKLRILAKERHPDAFKGVLDLTTFTPKKLKEITKKVHSKKRLVITSAVNGANVHKKFYASLKRYCKINDALLVVMPSYDPKNKVDQYLDWHFDPILLNDIIVVDTVYLNNNIRLFPMKTKAAQMYPTNGLARLGRGRGSFIFGSPKQSLDYIAISNQKYPHAIMSTGSITESDYFITPFLNTSNSHLSNFDHVLGAVIVEIGDKEEFHFRQIQSNEEGEFADLGCLYSPTKTSKIAPVIVLGDWHSGQTDPVSKRVSIEQIKQMGIKEGIFHDMFNGISANHHEWGQRIKLARNAAQDVLSIEKEGRTMAQEIEDMAKYLDRLYMVASNHGDFLLKYLEEGRFHDDPHNYRIGCELSVQMIDGKDPLQYLVEKFLTEKTKKKIVWLKRDEELKIGGFECGAHGDKGPNGSRGSLSNLEKSYGCAIMGHSHTPGIRRKMVQVGTNSYLNQSYNIGPSSWMQTNGLVYSIGQFQLLNNIFGQWRIK